MHIRAFEAVKRLPVFIFFDRNRYLRQSLFGFVIRQFRLRCDFGETYVNIKIGGGKLIQRV